MGYPPEAEWGELGLSSIRTHIYLKKLWAKALLPIGRVTMAKKKEAKAIAVCGACAMYIDLDELNQSIKADRTYTHACGRVLYWGENAEVPTSAPDDPVPSNTIERSSPSAGDA